MALSKRKISRKNFAQLTLLLMGLIIIFFTYFGNFKKKEDTTVVEDIKKIDQENQEESADNINRFEDVEYKGLDASGNRYVIGSKYANFTTDRPEIISMTNVECTFYLSGGNLYIVSDYAIFNNSSNDMEFTENVKMNYLENVLFSQKAIFENEKNELIIEGDVSSKGPNGKIRADRLDFDLNTKKLKISMYNDEKVNIKVKLQ
jgi:LPS export ABC transporter protein LptC|tara:strand:- start:598 stop:1209 length:612 start_codon:yes stop_codon:yes gene_type:complete